MESWRLGVSQTTREKTFSKTSFHLRIDENEKDKNKAEKKERKKTTKHLQKYVW